MFRKPCFGESSLLLYLSEYNKLFALLETLPSLKPL